jgi:subtilisin family serine protease
MRKKEKSMTLRKLTALAVALSVWGQTSPAQELRFGAMSTPPVQGWMSPEIGEAWSAGHRGRGATITVIDDFSSSDYLIGTLSGGWSAGTHGTMTYTQAALVAPEASLRVRDFSNTRSVALAKGFNVINLSYGMFAVAGHDVSDIWWGAREGSVINHARSGNALVVKSAGNDGVNVGAATALGEQDYLSSALIGTRSAIFAGALDRNGSVDAPASMASYSNSAGEDLRVQSQFLSVGVDTNFMGLTGTSFAAPIISGYGAIIHSKFRTATPTQVANRLLDTARTDTVTDYDPSVYGRGEASLTRALAPDAIQ